MKCRVKEIIGGFNYKGNLKKKNPRFLNSRRTMHTKLVLEEK
jgi:hypothetical protein